MGLLKSLFSTKTDQPNSYIPAEKAKIPPSDSDKAIANMQKADEVYKVDGNLEKRIAVYEKYLLKKPLWNASNFCLRLSDMYLKSGQNDKAWGYLNQMHLWTMDPNCPISDVHKIRFSQFKLLKTEKRHLNALIMLVSGYIVWAYSTKDSYFNKNRFLKEVRTTAKALGFSESEIIAFADLLENGIKTKTIGKSDAKQFCMEYLKRIENNE